MKRNVTLFIVSIFTTLVFAQISGGFYYGNGFVYFTGKNVSGYGLSNLTIKCVNHQLNQQQTFTMSFLANGNTFTIGPADGWQWQPGEQLIIAYANGQSVYWVYQPTSPSYNTVPNNNSTRNNLVIQEQIRQLESKIRDAERSLRLYEKWNDKNPSISNTQLINAQRQLIRTYQDRIQQLIRQIQ